jgi:hypothetical protein
LTSVIYLKTINKFYMPLMDLGKFGKNLAVQVLYNFFYWAVVVVAAAANLRPAPEMVPGADPAPNVY